MKLLRYALISFLSISVFVACDNKDDASKKKPPGKIVDLFVAEKKTECQEFVSACYLVQESESSDWGYMYNEIEGFQYEPGFIYQLKVEIQEVENPPQDASSVRYILREIISKTPAP